MDQFSESCRPLDPAPNLEVARRYLGLLYGEVAEGYLNLCHFDGKPITWYAANDLDALAQSAVVLGRDCNVYHSIGLRSQEYFAALSEPENERGGSDTVVGLPGLWLDVDFLDPAHTKTNLPPTPFDALDLIDELPLKPTLVVHSGHGFQAWYLFRQMWELPTDEERATAESLVRRFQRTVLAKAEAHGWKLDNTSDLARVFRVPGTLNWKNAAHPVPVKIVSCSSERRFDPVDFAPHLAPDAKLPQLDAELF